MLACDLSGAGGRPPSPSGPRFTVRVAGVVRTPIDINAIVPLVDSPWQQGWNWDVLVGNPNTVTDPTGYVVPRLAGDQLVGSYSALTNLNGGFTVDGAAVGNVLVFDPLKGAVLPPLLEGRPPRTQGEIVLGTSTLRQIGRHVGQTIKLRTPVGTATAMRIVGPMIVPSVADLLTNGLGEGAWVPDSYFRRLKAELAGRPNVPPLSTSCSPSAAPQTCRPRRRLPGCGTTSALSCYGSSRARPSSTSKALTGCRWCWRDWPPSRSGYRSASPPGAGPGTWQPHISNLPHHRPSRPSPSS